MSYHVSHLGSYGPTQYMDKQRYVPQETDGPWDLDYDHGHESTHNDDGSLTAYGEWWESERWPEIRDAAVAATVQAEKLLAESRKQQH